MGPKDFQSCDDGEVDGSDCWSPDFCLNDMEMDSPSPSDDHDDDDIPFWYPIADQMEVIVEFESVRDCSQIYSQVPFEEHGNMHL